MTTPPFPTFAVGVAAVGLIFVAANAYGIVNRHAVARSNRTGINRRFLQHVSHDEIVDSNVRVDIVGIVLGAAIYGTGVYMVIRWFVHAAKAWL